MGGSRHEPQKASRLVTTPEGLTGRKKVIKVSENRKDS